VPVKVRAETSAQVVEIRLRGHPQKLRYHLS
jgi:hypothetical protein